jgi:hydrophobe/amphiphile efflux-3 (HAE3) family protein
MNKLFAFLAASSEKRPWLVVGCVLVITVFLMSGIGMLKTEFSQEGMLPKDYQSVKALKTVQNNFGGLSYENVLLVTDNVTSSGIAEALLALSPQSLEAAGMKKGAVLKVETYLDALNKMVEAQGITLPKGFMLGGAVQQFLATPYAQAQIVGKTISKDNRATLIKLQIDPGMTEKKQIQLAKDLESYFNAKFKAKGAKVYVSGAASTQKDAQELMARQTGILFLIALLFIMLVLYVTFRRVSDVFLLMFVIVVGIFWIIGLMGWVGITYSTMSVAIMPLMLGINIAYVIHILSRYYEEREAGGDIFYSSTTSVKTVGVAVFLTAITTVFGFASFTITDIAPLKDFGIVCMVGIAFSFVLAITLLPAVVVIRDRRKKAEKLESHLEKMRKRRRDSRYGAVVDKGLVNASMTAYRHHWIVIICVLVLVGFGVFSIFNLQTGADIRSMMGGDSPSVKASDMIAKYFGAQDADVILVKGDVLSPASLKAMLKLEEEVAADSRNKPGAKGSFTREGNISIADIVANANGGSIPDSPEAVKSILAELGKQMDVSSLVSKDGNYAIVMVRSATPKTQAETDTKAKILRDAAVKMKLAGLDAKATGFSVLIADLMGNIVPTQLETSGLALVLCLLILIIVFKSFFYGLITLVVVVCGMSAEMVFLYAMGWSLDIMTVLVASLVIGAGIDFGIHVTHRFREQRHDHGMSLEDSVRTTVLHVGRALIAGGLTTAGVFGILGISSMVPLRHFGWTTAVGLLAALLGALFVLPSMLVILSKWLDRRAAAKGADAPSESPS